MELNQVTLPTTDIRRAVAFYTGLGFRQIVDAPHYARFECRSGGPSISIHSVQAVATDSQVVVYFECEDLDRRVEELRHAGIQFDTAPTDQSWLWREAYLRDPDGNRLCLYHAGVNRLHPPWRVETASRTFQIEGIDHVALAVRDVGRAVRWYQDVLGLQRRYENAWGDYPAVVGVGPTTVALFPVEGDMPQPPPGRDVLAMRHLAFRVDAGNFSRAQQELRGKGIMFELQDHGIAHSIYLRDPDGHEIEITTYDVGERQPTREKLCNREHR